MSALAQQMYCMSTRDEQCKRHRAGDDSQHILTTMLSLYCQCLSAFTQQPGTRAAIEQPQTGRQAIYVREQQTAVHHRLLQVWKVHCKLQQSVERKQTDMQSTKVAYGSDGDALQTDVHHRTQQRGARCDTRGTLNLPLNAAATYTRTKIVKPKEVAMDSTLELSSRQSVGVAIRHTPSMLLYIWITHRPKYIVSLQTCQPGVYITNIHIYRGALKTSMLGSHINLFGVQLLIRTCQTVSCTAQHWLLSMTSSPEGLTAVKYHALSKSLT